MVVVFLAYLDQTAAMRGAVDIREPTNMKAVKQAIKQAIPAVINIRLLRHLEPAGKFFRKVAYGAYYLAWYNKQNIRKCLLPTAKPFGHENRFAVYEQILASLKLTEEQINYLEFGVHKGESIGWWLEQNRHPGSRFTGFDSFRGLPEDWGDVPKGEFSTGGVPPPGFDDPRCNFVIGLFQETLTPSECRLASSRTIVHLDADLYSSTLFVLMALDRTLETDDLLIFDEFAYVTDEFRAFLDYQSATSRKLEAIAAVNCGDVIAFRVC